MSPRARSLPLLAILVAGAACGPAAPAPATVTPTTTPATSATSSGDVALTPAPLDVDPIAVGLGRSKGGPGGEQDDALAARSIAMLCDASLLRAKDYLQAIRAKDGAPAAELTWDATLGAFDRARVAIRNAGDFPALMAVAHPSPEVRESAKACEPKLDELDTSIWLDEKLARVIKAYADKKEELSGPRARLLLHVVRDFRRNGLELDEAGKTRLRAINEELTRLGQEFDSNIAASQLTVEASPSQLEGLPEEWLTKHPPKDGKVTLSTDYPDYFPVLTYAKDRKLALELHKQFDNRAADKNVAVLDRILLLRHEKATLLGYATWADYVIEPRMAKDGKTVATFLEGLRKHLAKKGEAEMQEFRAMRAKLGIAKASDPMPASERLYLEDQVRRAKYGLDSKEVSKYFEVSRVKQGLLTITSKLFGLTFRPVQTPTWHPDVEPVEVLDTQSGKVLGSFYFDLYPREGKYKHAAVFSIRDTVKLDDGSRLTPIAAIECNFPRPQPGSPALMSHQDVVTFFHEFGHVLHHLLSESELSRFAGTSVARDFVESPSQMLEEWAWAKETLDMFAAHHETGKPLPADLHAAMLRSRGFGRGIATQRQLFLAALDQRYHTTKPPFDTTKVLQETHDAYTPFKYVEGTHFQASFGHLIGYDAGYYGYQWALSIAQDLFTRFAKEGLMNTKVAADYRRSILAPGSSEDESKLVERFLGRPTSDVAYKKFLLQ